MKKEIFDTHLKAIDEKMFNLYKDGYFNIVDLCDKLAFKCFLEMIENQDVEVLRYQLKHLHNTGQFDYS